MREAEEIADALDGGVAIGLAVLGEQLAGMQPALRVAADDIREGAAAVDPEIPGSSASRRCSHSRPILVRFAFSGSHIYG
jgi:hypothetical protein